MKMMSLFDGSGGFPLAASMCGIYPVYASEVEPYPIAVTRSRFPHMRHLGDVSKVNGADLEPVDIVTFGSPCQDMSIAGKRAGIKHEGKGDEETTRSGLFMEAVRIIREMREATDGVYPAFAVWENVPGAFSSNKGEDFRLVLEELIKIVEPDAAMPGVPKNGWAYADCYRGDGWSLAYRTLDAQYWGVPQRRRRIYLVLDLGGRRAGKILFEREGLRGHFEAGRTPWESTSADVAGGPGADDSAIPYTLKIRSGCEGGGKGTLVQENKSATLAACSGQYLFAPVILDDQGGGQISTRADGKSPTLRAEMHGHPPCIVQAAGFKAGQGAQARSIGWQAERSPTLTASNSGTQLAPTVVCKCYDARGNDDGKTACMAHGQANAEVCQGMSPTLNCNHEQPIVFGKEVYNSGINATGGHYISSGGPAPTLRHDSHPPGVCTRYIARRLTPTECARLQGFPDRWGDINPLDVSDAQEVEFWREVYKTFCAVSGRNQSAAILTKPASLAKWHDGLHTDSAEYKMWGNGIALPNALYVMQGIEAVLTQWESTRSIGRAESVDYKEQVEQARQAAEKWRVENPIVGVGRLRVDLMVDDLTQAITDLLDRCEAAEARANRLEQELIAHTSTDLAKAHDALSADWAAQKKRAEKAEHVASDLRDDFTDFVTSGVHNAAPYCANCRPECVDGRGWCIGDSQNCKGFTPKAAGAKEE